MNDHFKTICELLNGKSSLNSVADKTVTWTGNIYYYVFDQQKVKTLMSMKSILPIDKLNNPGQNAEYAKRATTNNLPGVSEENREYDNAKIYWKFIYDKFYKPVVKKPYRNYGIYLTPLDLFKFDSGMHFRLKIPYDSIKKFIKNRDVVIAVGSKVKLITDIQDIVNVLSVYDNYDTVETIWKSSKLKFQRLPQIIVFADAIPISISDAEKRSGLVSEAIVKELSPEERRKLKDSHFGLPKQRKYPLHDKQHVVLSVRGFYKCPEENKPELAVNILKAAKKFGVNIGSPEIHEYAKKYKR